MNEEKKEEEEIIVPDYELNLDNIPKVGSNGHNWQERGLFVTCNGAGTHPPHRHPIRNQTRG